MTRTSRSSSATSTGGTSSAGTRAGRLLNTFPSSSSRRNSRRLSIRWQGLLVSRFSPRDDVPYSVAGRGHFGRLGVLIHGAQEVDVHPLLFAQNAWAAELPPLVGREVRGDLGLTAGLGEPLDQVQVVRLQQPEGDVHQVGMPGQLRLVVDVVHQPEDSLLRFIAEEEIHAAVAGPGAAVLRQRHLVRVGKGDNRL